MQAKNMKRAKLYFFYLIAIHCIALLFFFFFRLILLVSADYQFNEEFDSSIAIKSVAFLRGVWFDNVIGCYILLLPLLLLWGLAIANRSYRWAFNGIAYFFIFMYSLSFIISAANIPYFGYFFKNINSSIYNWFSYGSTTAGMVFGETSFYVPIALAVLSILLFGGSVITLSKYFYRLTVAPTEMPKWRERMCITGAGVLCIGLCLFGIRGRMGYNPIKISQAYYCTDPFLNQLGINPVFNLLTSTLDDQRKENNQLHLMPETEALTNVQALLHRKGVNGISPIAQRVESIGNDATTRKPNIVLVFMESMSANLMQSFGQKKTLTPFLDSLYHQSLSFDHFYSAGIHTNHGMYATLYSFPAIMKRNAMKGTVIPIYSGLPTVLQEQGYLTSFFMTHESQYDNMNAFFRTNGFDEIYAQENYPKDKVVNSFGVQDDFLYQYALPVLNKHAQSGRPFFSVLLSVSNHPPYVIPPYFHPKSEKLEDQIVEYADWSIKQLMGEAQKQPWFDNTIFVFLGDHGKMVGTPDCEMPSSYNHVPLMIYGKRITPQIKDCLGGQIDVAPTLLGMLNIDYMQNNFGVDLLKEARPCMFFTADNMVGARNDSCFYIYSPESSQEFEYIEKDGNLHKVESGDFDKLKKYCFSMLQSAEYLVRKQNTTDKPVTKP